MKSINQILKGRSDLIDEPEVLELIEYCRELEDELVEKKQTTDQTTILKQLVFEIKTSCTDLLKEDEKADRWSNDFDEIDFKEAIINLKEYISLYCFENRIIL